MDVEHACKLLNDELIYPHGWQVVAKSATHLHGGTVHVSVRYPGVKTGPDEAPQGYPTPNINFAGFFLVVGDLVNDDDLARLFLVDVLRKVREHEDREQLRWRATLRSPFHPHTVDGRAAWGTGETDNTFGYPVFLPQTVTRVDTFPQGYELFAEEGFNPNI